MNKGPGTLDLDLVGKVVMVAACLILRETVL